MIDQDDIRARFEAVAPHLNERTRRLVAATEARTAGRGGIVAVSQATGIARSTIWRGLKDLEEMPLPPGTLRRSGGGRPAITVKDPTLLTDLQRIVEPAQMGDPMRPLLWVSKSLAKIAVALTALGHRVSLNTVSRLLEESGYLRLKVRKTEERSSHPDRDAQFEYINDQACAFLEAQEPAISVDTKKKELIGNFQNAGSDYRARGCPEQVRVHDFVDPQLGKAVPYGIYDVGANTGYVSVGVDHDTAQFAVNSIRSWWYLMGQARYPHAKRLMISADGGGSNGSRVRLWKVELQKLADELGLEICVCHYPPGCSKWNKIEHRLFCQITQNWRGTPLISRIAIVELIAATKTTTGLIVRGELDTREYPSGIKVTDAQLAAVNLTKDAFHPEWNYSIKPTVKEAIILNRALLLTAAISIANACATALPQDTRAHIDSEDAIIVWDATTQTEHFIRTAGFETDAKDLGFLVPTPTVPALNSVDAGVLDTLLDLTSPQVITHVSRPWRIQSILPMFGTAASSKLSITKGSYVAALETRSVAGFDATTLEASDPDALTHWLTKHGYTLQPQTMAWLAPYIAKHWKITAFKIAKANPGYTDVMSSLVDMTFKTDQPFFPYSEPKNQRDASSGSYDREFYVYLFSNHRMNAVMAPNAKHITWPGTTPWANPIENPQRTTLSRQLGMTLPPDTWLTQFEDQSSPRPGVADLVFKPSAKQTKVTPTPSVQYLYEPRKFWIDPILIVLGILILIPVSRWWKRIMKLPGD